MNPELKKVAKYMKRSLIFSRIMGIVFCLIAAGTLALLYFNIFDQWMCMITLSFSMAGIFISNSSLQNIRSIEKGRTWQIINLILAFVCYCAVITFVTMGFLNGAISFSF